MSSSPASPITAVIFDWAGTVIDFGCMAPVVAFRAAFAETGFEISEAEAREPMGAAKREHIAMILAATDVQARWLGRFGAASTEASIDDLYARFLRLDAQSTTEHSGLIPGALDTLAALRARGAGIGSTTGYPREIMDRILRLAAAQGYAPDSCVTVSDVERGRPWPDMVQAAAAELGAADPARCVVVDDSPTGLEAARKAGMWAVGVSASGNEVGLPLEVWTALGVADRAQRLERATQRLHDAGAHVVVESIADLLPVIDTIQQRLDAGERP
ncbi:phosphonoacetaldehyde hydrolase [Caulobacter sp. RHG1]|uniref:phosphonoacetaldehyde hydrolase n=1 Tax=Caulobacter sp. (strain RHG1) TaxID=2545762 RepID=UPI001551BF73|nr:phosphonoacetaldehyde hydrolase [Caulobacter sp. RHG1]NQE62572.1 Phosphonoacetaldehyde hydrolase [Caulobacter sp. RHG1]